jgi:hypothetical protein
MTRTSTCHKGWTRVTALGLLIFVACGEPTSPTRSPTADHPLSAVVTSTLSPNTWTTVAPMPEKLGRYEFTAGVANDAAGRSITYVFGGRYFQAPSDPLASSILAYDITTDTWTIRTAKFEGFGTNGVGKIGGLLYISGGSDVERQSSSRLLAYDVGHDRMIRKADMPEATSEGITGVIDGKLYVLAGTCGQSACKRLYRYDPATNVWKALPSPPNHHWRGAGVVLNGKFYVAGGGAFKPFRALDVYDPTTNMWTALGSMPSGREIAVGVGARGRIFVVGIQYPDRTTFSYSPMTGTWSKRAPFPSSSKESTLLSAPSAAVKVVLEARGYVLTLGSIYFFSDGSRGLAPSFLYAP